MIPQPPDDSRLADLDPSGDSEAEDSANEEGEEEPVAPELPPGLEADREAAEIGPDDEELKAYETAFLRTLPPGDVAILRLFADHPENSEKFGWLVGRSAKGALLPLRLAGAPSNDWRLAFQALQGGSPGTPPGTTIWSDADELSRSWKRRGPALYQLMNVDLPNLHDGAGLALKACRKAFGARTISLASLAIAELVCREPHVYWWLVFDHGSGNWAGLLAALTGKYKSLAVSLTVASLEQQWRQEGLPLIRKALAPRTREE